MRKIDKLARMFWQAEWNLTVKFQMWSKLSWLGAVENWGSGRAVSNGPRGLPIAPPMSPVLLL